MRRKTRGAVPLLCSLALVLSACGSDDEEDAGSGGPGGNAGGGTLRIGVLTSLSGPAAAASEGALDGIEARLAAYEADGGECAEALDFEVVVADDQSSPQGALSGIQKLVQQDEVYAVIAESGLFFGASQWAVTQGAGTPVIGGAFDGAPEWRQIPDVPNLFPNFTVPDYETVYSTAGDYFAAQGATKVAGVGYASPSSQAGLANGLASIEAAGIETVYTNDSVQFGSTDVGAIVLNIIDSGADSLYLTINPDTAFAVLAGLRQADHPIELVSSPTGYGADLLENPTAVELAQGVSFTSSFAPIELQTDATRYLSDALREHAGIASGIPGFFTAQGWFGADLLLHGLEAAGCDAPQEEFISTLRNDTSWDAGGLFPDPVPMNDVTYDQQCQYYVTMEGEGFVPVEDASPLCGEPLDD